MAKVQIYSIYDKTAKTYNRPMEIINKGKAMQVFQAMVNEKEKQSDLSRWPDQFSLYHIADFDNETGKLDAFTEPQHIANGVEVLQQENIEFTLPKLFDLWEKWQNEQNITNIKEAQK